MNDQGEVRFETGFTEGLVADGSAEVEPGKLDLFGQFIGSWSVGWSGRGSNLDRVSMRGNVRFDWLIEGQAVQDVWEVPTADQYVMSNLNDGIHGTTVRFYDPSFDTWRCVWIEPSKAVVRQFYGWREGDDIILFSDEEKPYVRWCFTEISDRSFVILRETSPDNGSTWDLEEEMRLTRIENPRLIPES